MRIVIEHITLDELKHMVAGMFGDRVKAGIDVDRELVALDGELDSERRSGPSAAQSRKRIRRMTSSILRWGPSG